MKTIELGIILSIVLVYVIFFSKEKKAPDGDRPILGRSTFVNDNNVDEVKEQLKQPIEDGYFRTRMSIDWTFENGSSVSKDAYVANAKENTRMVYFDVTLDTTGDLVYSSPYMPLGTELKDIKLTKKLSKGTYPAVVTYNLVDDSQNIVSNVSVAVTIHILN